MKILTILATPSGERGNTAILLEEVLKGAKSLKAECETVVLKGNSIKPCTGCNQCHKRGYCKLKDDFEAIKEKLLESDGIIIATPNYIFHVSGQLKVFLDRCASLLHCMALEGKYGMSVITSGGGDEFPIVQYINNFFVRAGVTPVDAIWAEMGTTKDGRLDEKSKELAFLAGKNLVEAIKNKKRIAMVEKIKDSHLKRMIDLMNYYKNEWPYEYNYFKEHNRL
jgi:multimeric flavodoxin WrbA